MDFIHKNSSAYLILALVALHATAALYHHYVRKDLVLVRNLSPRWLKTAQRPAE